MKIKKREVNYQVRDKTRFREVLIYEGRKSGHLKRETEEVSCEICLNIFGRILTVEIARKELPSYLYILRCANNGLYIGIATDIKKRLQEHKEGHGSSYTKTRTPVKLVYVKKFPNRYQASIMERRLKVYKRERKERLLQSFYEKWKKDTNKSFESALEITENLEFSPRTLKKKISTDQRTTTSKVTS